VSDSSGIDVDRARADTPGCRDVVHLNNAGSSLPPRQVVEAQVDYLKAEALSGGYELATERADQLADTYAALADLIGARPNDIALMSNATEAWQLAFNSFRFQDGDRILTSEAEYASNYIEFLRVRRNVDISIEPIPSDETGATSAATLANMIDDRVRLIAITHVPTNGGLINPAAEIGRVAKDAGVPYLLDACQSVGQMDLDVAALGCDFLSATGRKFLRGPRGTGFLYAKPSILDTTEPPVLDLNAATWTSLDRIEIRPDVRRYENWEFNYAAVRGLGVAARYALGFGLERIERRVGWLAEELRARLARVDGVTCHDLGLAKAGIVTFTVAGVAAGAVQEALSSTGINSSVTTPASTLVDASRRRLPDLVRMSPHYYNTTEELDQAVAPLAAIAAG